MNVYLPLHPFLKIHQATLSGIFNGFRSYWFSKRHFTCIVFVQLWGGQWHPWLWHNNDWKLPKRTQLLPATAPADRLACTLCLMMIKQPICSTWGSAQALCTASNVSKRGVCTSGYWISQTAFINFNSEKSLNRSYLSKLCQSLPFPSHRMAQESKTLFITDVCSRSSTSKGAASFRKLLTHKQAALPLWDPAPSKSDLFQIKREWQWNEAKI